MPKIVDYDERRKIIAEKAVSVLVRDGLKEANLGKIAELCDFGRTTIYKYFRNIEEIIVYTLEGVFGILDEKAQAVNSDPSLTSTEKLLAILELFEREAVTDRERMILILDFLLHPDRLGMDIPFNVQERVRELRRAVEVALEAAVREGALKPMDTASMAFTLFCLVEAATIHGALYNNTSLPTIFASTKILVDGLKTSPPDEPRKIERTPRDAVRLA